ncbi:uncharacterized protein LOC125858797 [Solanum stenotomum]|uniref:uncharacterized protein LOC125858797 n=1 Tax=Solanum stenotomum TaxID=172797 RepID=UPI0020D1AB6B|nr:uncharacterized protein LOC125858797 [Solanum stenotomum]
MGVSRAYFAKIATCETAKEAWESLETEVYGDEKVRTINLQTLRREFQNLKMIESEKIDEYCTRVMNIVNEKRNHGDTISDQQVVEKILIIVTEKYEYIVPITKEMKDLSKDHDDSSMKVEEKGEKSTSLFCKICKRANHNAEKYWHKGKPQCNFRKIFGHIENDCWHKQQDQTNFCEEQEEEMEENLFFASQCDVSAKSNKWYIDSGCSNHMTGDEKVFLSINSSITTKERMGNGVSVDAKDKATISINIKRSDNYCKIYDKIEPNQVIVEVEMTKRKFPLQIQYNAFKIEVVDDSYLWHKSFCHLNFHDLKLLKQKDTVQGLPEIHTEIKVENTSIISLDVSNQEEDEK